MHTWLWQLPVFVAAQQAQESIAPVAQSSAVRLNSVWDLVVKGGPVMIPIGLCSLIALTVIVERAVYLRKRRVIPPSFWHGLRAVLKGHHGNRVEAIAFCRSDGSPTATVFAGALRWLGSPREVLERQIQESAQRVVRDLRRRLRSLSVIASLATLLGLLGTITGMIDAFQTVAASGEALGRTELLARGIYEAMITTAAGLIVAIPATVAFHWLSAKVESLMVDMDAIAIEFVDECGGASPLHDTRSITLAAASNRDGHAAPTIEAERELVMAR